LRHKGVLVIEDAESGVVARNSVQFSLLAGVIGQRKIYVA
jgi:hypothetical protein